MAVITNTIDGTTAWIDEVEEIAGLDALIAQIDTVRVAAQSRGRSAQRHLFAKPWPVFIRTMRLLSSQSWGSKVEAYLREVHGWEKVDPSLELGDARVRMRETGEAPLHYEIKTSILTATNSTVNFVQIRPHHGVDGYQLFVVRRDYSVVHYTLTSAQMQGELALLGSLAHGTVGSGTKAQANAEWAIRFEWDELSTTVLRWRSYQVACSGADSLCCSKDAVEA